MTEMVEFLKLSYYSYRGGKKLHQICSASCIFRTVFELKNILASLTKVTLVYFRKGTGYGDKQDSLKGIQDKSSDAHYKLKGERTSHIAIASFK